MKFFDAVAKCYRNYAVFKGRASRSEFWYGFLTFLLFAWPLLLAETQDGTWFTILSFIYFILTISIILPLFAVWTRRMHDVGKSGWAWLFIFLPIGGLIVLLIWLTKEGKQEVNKYGEPVTRLDTTTKVSSGA